MKSNYINLSDNSLEKILGGYHAYNAAAIRRNNRAMQGAADFANGFFHGFF
ncbi:MULTISPECIES: hypothetical protein [Lactiplantibacillus]|uniref:hypothetical protein n=1 Tax=Lactiplantibacillus TaxID=2767842 RepID=UPI000ADEF84F|nr:MULTISPECIES: hypothetical protein [Lactiplantibacillus]MBU7449562.1 hypothetical protein [Lactiplantibacillus sp. 7.2.4]MBU7495109.1 hypothetical protein [Lactiplantibacillus pentosus]MBU7521104.1 hypothetical protein [Lactiplantibacillus pentosus]